MIKKEGRGFQKLRREVGSENMNRINSMLMSGLSPARVAEVIQKEWGKYTETKTLSLGRMLQRYREENLGTHMIAALEPEERKELLGKAIAKMDTVAELQELIEVQKKRVVTAAQQEEQLGGKHNFAWLSKDIRLLADLIKDVTTMHIDLGMVQYYGPKVAQVNVNQNVNLNQQNQTDDSVVATVWGETAELLNRIGMMTDEVTV